MPRITRIALAMAIAAMAIGRAAPAAASTISFDFDCNITGPNCTSTASIGTLTISDNVGDPNSVDVTITLFSGGLQQLDINYSGFPLPSGYSFVSSNGSVTVSANGVQADGYTIGLFDMQFPSTGNLTGSTYTTTLSLTDGGSGFVNLDPLNFAVFAAGGTGTSDLYAAVQKTQGNSWYGATTCNGCGEDVTPTPEPASLLLFGSGLSAVAFRLRRGKKSTDS